MPYLCGMSKKRDIRALTREQLREYFTEIGDKAFRGDQVFEWLWNKSAKDFSDMTNLSKALREHVEAHFAINHVHVDKMQKSSDGTIKNAIRLHDGLVVESVLIPTDTRITACISSQVGCSLDCQFCATARLKRMRNLNPDEIYDQVVAIKEQAEQIFECPLTNIVLMGMGEPLMNYKNVLAAIDKITSPEGLGMSPKRITLSTVGVAKGIRRLADDDVKFNLALSLHSGLEDVRKEIMPFTEFNPLDQLKDALKYWHGKTGKKVTYEYVVWKGINDRDEDINALLEFCRLVPSKVNLIQYNPIGDTRFIPVAEPKLQHYIDRLRAEGVVVNVRISRGQDIDAACGQLANKESVE